MKNIFASGELIKDATVSKTETVQADGSRQPPYPPCLIVTIRLDDLTEAFGEDGIKTMLETLDAADKLPEYTLKAWVSLQWALEYKEDNRAFSEEEKMNRLKERYENEPWKSEMAAKMLEGEPV